MRSQSSPREFRVSYYYGRTRSTITSALWNIRGARSETAVLAYLRAKHPRTEITIMSVEFC